MTVLQDLVQAALTAWDQRDFDANGRAVIRIEDLEVKIDALRAAQKSLVKREQLLARLAGKPRDGLGADESFADAALETPSIPLEHTPPNPGLDAEAYVSDQGTEVYDLYLPDHTQLSIMLRSDSVGYALLTPGAARHFGRVSPRVIPSSAPLNALIQAIDGLDGWVDATSNTMVLSLPAVRAIIDQHRPTKGSEA